MKGGHLPAVGFEGRNIPFNPGEIVQSAASRKAREDVIHAERQTPLGQIGQQAYEVVAAALDFEVLAFREIEDTDVHRGAAGHAAGDLFAEEKVCVTAQGLGRADGIMVGERHQIHAFSLEHGVDFPRIVVGFAANALQHRDGAHPRVMV